MAASGSTQVEALEEGQAFAELAGWRVVAVRGIDARRWLHDLVTADVARLGAGEARRSLLLTPTGRIRADLHVMTETDSFLLLQPPDQPAPIGEILKPYVLSSHVELRDLSDRKTLFAVLGGSAAEDGADGLVSSPSVLGPGHNVVVSAGDAARRLRSRLTARGLEEASPTALETWRIRRGVPRMEADFGQDSLPAEAGLEGVIDFTKGCFLGQESVAKVRNLGHPPRVLIAVRSEGAVAEGALVVADGSPVGEITSVAAADGQADAIARVRWDAADAALSTATGPLLVRRIR